MAHVGKTQLTYVISVPSDLVAEGDRLFASHGPWMESTHGRSGDTALNLEPDAGRLVLAGLVQGVVSLVALMSKFSRIWLRSAADTQRYIRAANSGLKSSRRSSGSW